jgi:Domain of unknown function(DUF2779)
MPLLTKSRFALVLDCPTKLYYKENKQYADKTLDDPFLLELAKGGFQVGALARCYYPNGYLIDRRKTNSYKALAKETLRLLQQENVIIYEAAFLYNNYFIHADIIEKKGSTIKLVEVKAKSFRPSEDKLIKQNQSNPKWDKYLFDVAFQNWVIKNSLAENGFDLKIENFLMLADKEATATANGLNQHFFFKKDTREIIISEELKNNPAILGNKVLCEINVNPEVEFIQQAAYPEGSFAERVKHYCEALISNTKIDTPVSVICKKCEFKNPENISNKQDGFKECWSKMAGFKENDFAKALAYNVWDFRKSDEFISSGRYFMEDLRKEDLEPKTKSKSSGIGMSRTDRQYLQILKYKSKDDDVYIRMDDLKEEMVNWKYPLHLIDFETTTTALPFYKNMHPYETVAFQFSHHIFYKDGKIEHEDEWINVEKGFFPNFQFARKLKEALTKDNGSVFRYAAHENTVLNHIYNQLEVSSETDKKELQKFIKTITHRKDKNKKNKFDWYGERSMIDLCDVIKKYYYNPLTNGSNSIKDVLPAILNTSKYLQEKYSAPVYGTSLYKSKNFLNQTWIEFANGKVKNPYKLLPPVFSETDDKLLDEKLSDEDSEIKEGGAAMAAYGLLQFSAISKAEADVIIKALLKYCELDTLAMVMIIEEFKNLIK